MIIVFLQMKKVQWSGLLEFGAGFEEKLVVVVLFKFNFFFSLFVQGQVCPCDTLLLVMLAHLGLLFGVLIMTPSHLDIYSF